MLGKNSVNSTRQSKFDGPLGFGSTASNGDLFGGSGQGRLTVTQSATKGLVAKGKASFQLGSNPHNFGLINATANGQFQFTIDPQGNMTFKITRGKANFKLGSYAGGPLASGSVVELATNQDQPDGLLAAGPEFALLLRSSGDERAPIRCD